MLISLSYIFLVGMFLSWICKKVGLPGLLGMIFTGILLGPYCLGLIDSSLLNISSELRKIALIIILMRAGLNLDLSDLKRVGRPAILMCFVPACFEMVGMILSAPKLLGISLLDAAIMGSVVAAVSPAVIVPKMLQLMDEGYGTKESIPLSILTGIICGALLGKGFAIFFKKNHMRDTVKILILLSVAFILATLEDALPIPFSGLIAIMFMGIFLQRNHLVASKRLSVKFNKLWVGAEVLLFVLVGACVNISYALKAGVMAILLIFGVLLFRMLGVFICLLKTSLAKSERLFCMIAYCPKATVQAAIGSVPLAAGLGCGQIVLTVAVLSILITAPLGAFLIEHTYKKWLKKEQRAY